MVSTHQEERDDDVLQAYVRLYKAEGSTPLLISVSSALLVLSGGLGECLGNRSHHPGKVCNRDRLLERRVSKP